MKFRRSQLIRLIIGGSVLFFVALPIVSAAVKYISLQHTTDAFFTQADQRTTAIAQQLQAALPDYKLAKPAMPLVRCPDDSPYTPTYSCFRGVVLVMQREPVSPALHSVTQSELQQFVTAHKGSPYRMVMDLGSLASDMQRRGHWTATYSLADTGIPGVPQTDTTTAELTADLKVRFVNYNFDTDRKQTDAEKADFPGQHDSSYYAGVAVPGKDTLLVVVFQKYGVCKFDLFVCPGGVSHFSESISDTFYQD